MKKEIKNLMSTSLSFLPDEPYCKITHFLKMKKWPNLKNPKYFNEKLLAMKLSVRDELSKTLADKYEVREYIKQTLGNEYLIPLIGVYSDPSEVDFDKLPNKFVLKLTNGAQNNLICTDKSKLDWEKESLRIRNWLKIDPYVRTREWQYKDLEPRFVIEEYVSDSNGNTYDYKFWCFNGIPEMVQIDADRFGNHKRNFYNADTFEKMDIVVTHPHTDTHLEPPKNYNEMLEIATTLSERFPFVRIDLYNLDGKIYFGEITFYPGNCNEKIHPFDFEYELGEKLDLELLAGIN